jgi:hypothetical protein
MNVHALCKPLDTIAVEGLNKDERRRKEKMGTCILMSQGGGALVASVMPRAAKRSGDSTPAFFSFMSN